MKRKRFLDSEEIEEITNTALRVFDLHPDEILVSIEEREIEIPDPFRDGARGRKPAQVITFAEGDFPAPPKGSPRGCRGERHLPRDQRRPPHAIRR
jgi:hypothetical protein